MIFPTKIWGILGYPVKHSLSPDLHNAGFRALEMNDCRYVRFDVSPHDLENFITKVRSNDNLQGLSVTIPHKEEMFQYMDEVDDAATQIGAINTVYKKNGKLIGTNTDFSGFVQSFLEHSSLSGKRALVLGAGGAARAIVYGLQKEGVTNISIANRTREKAELIAQDFDIKVVDVSDLDGLKESIDIVVNTTSLGMEGKNETLSPVLSSFWCSHHEAFDIVYTPRDTVFLSEAKHSGAKAYSGEKMFLFQGLSQFQIFTGMIPPRKKMEKVLDAPKNILEKITSYSLGDFYISGTKTEKVGISKYPFLFWDTLFQKRKNPHLIAEIKPASPSNGKLFRQGDDVSSLARIYEENGASAISVLTDTRFFGGCLENISLLKKEVSIPVLRKDFIVHPDQIEESHQIGADAVLLMRSVLSIEQINQCLDLLKSFEMDALVEVHSREELEEVLSQTSARIIGVNTRDFMTLQIYPDQFQVLMVDTRERYPDKVFVCESGITTRKDRDQYANEADAILVGTGIIQSLDRAKKIQELTS